MEFSLPMVQLYYHLRGSFRLNPATSIDTLGVDTDKVDLVQNGVEEEVKGRFNSFVEEVFRRADSESLISAIVIITRVAVKINPKSPRPC